MAQEQFIPEQQQQQPFIPQLDEATTRTYISQYQQNPAIYDENHLNSLRNHAYHYNIPFYEGEFSIFEAIKQAGAGFVEGFTTLNLAEHPDNVYEMIARNVGHLAGFAPGIIANPLSKVRALRGIAAAIPKRGIPLAVAEDILEPQAKRLAKKLAGSSYVARTDAFQSAANFLSQPLAKDIATGAFRLGTASAISSWQGGIDSMVDSFFHGAVAGGVFKVIGNKINNKDPKAEKFARGLAGSLFMGLPATVRGATMPEQIYEYLMGAYFGGNEVPWTLSKARKLHVENKKFARTNKEAGLEYTMNPEDFPTWSKAEPEVKKELYKLAFQETGLQASERGGLLAYELAEKLAELGHPEYKKQIEKAKKVRDPDNIDNAYNKELKKSGKLQKEVEDLNAETQKLETDLFNTEHAFKKTYEKDVDIVNKRTEKTKGEVRWDFNEYSLTKEGRKLLKSDPEFKEWYEAFNKKIHNINQVERKGFKADQVLQGSTKKATKLAPKKTKKTKVILTSGETGAEAIASKEAAKRNIATVQGIIPDLAYKYRSKEGEGTEVPIPPKALESMNATVTSAFRKINEKAEWTGDKKLKTETYKADYIKDLRGKAYLMEQAKDIVIFGDMNSTMSGLSGLNRVIGEMATMSKKPFYIYGGQGGSNFKGWFKYNPKKENIIRKDKLGMFEPIDIIPELSEITAFFGPKSATKGEGRAIESLFSKQPLETSGELSSEITQKETSLNFDVLDADIAEGFNITLSTGLGTKINSHLARNKDFLKAFPDIKDRQNAIKDIIITAKKNSQQFLETKDDLAGVYETRSTEWINSIEKTLPKGTKFDNEIRGDLRQWLVVAKWGKPVTMFVSDGKLGGTVQVDPESGRTLSLKMKKRVAPESIIDEIFKKYESGEITEPIKSEPIKGPVTRPTRPPKDVVEWFEIVENSPEYKDLLKKASPSEKHIFPKLIKEGRKTTEDIYKSLGSKTETDIVKNVGVEGIWKAKKENDPNTIIAFRVSKTKGFLKSFKEHQAVGNPINWTKLEGNRVKKGTEATKGFIDWLLGKKYTNLEQEYRKELLRAINSGKLKGKKIVYYQEANRPTHATALDYFINKTGVIHAFSAEYNPLFSAGFNPLPDKFLEKGPRYTQSKAGVRHVPELTGKDLTKTTKEVRRTIENTEGVTLRSGHKAVWFGPTDYVYTGAKHKAKEMPNNIKELKNEVEDALNLPRDYYDSVLMNNLPKNTRIPAHQDAEGIFRQKDGTIGSVGVLSLGGKSVIDIQKPRGKSVEKHTIKSGDVYELPAGQFQATKIDHYHEVGPSKTDRLSLTFRRTKFAPELAEPVSQPVAPTKTPKITLGPKNGYIDSIAFNGQDVELIRYQQKVTNYLLTERDNKGAKKYPTYEKAAEKAAEMKTEAIKNIVKDMYKKHDMHLWGGEGDKDRLVFVKHHPMTDSVKLPTDFAFTKMLNETIEFGQKNYGITREQEIRGLKSILKYHEDINGVSIENFVGKDGFINNAVKMNKRLPVILNTGWRGDKMLMQTLGLNLSNQGNFKAFITSDKKVLGDILGLKSSEMEQITDGATLAEVKTLEAQQFDRGTRSEQGQEKSVVLDGSLMLKHMSHATSQEFSKAMREYKNTNPELGEGINFIIYNSAAKQTGGVKAGDYKFEPAKTKIKTIKTGLEIEQEWNDYVDTPNLTDPKRKGSKLIIRRNDHFLKYDKKAKKMVDMFDPIKSKVEFANTMREEGIGNYTYNKTTNKFEDIIDIKTTKSELLLQGGEVFEIDPGSFRYNYGVYDGPSNLGVKNGVYKGIEIPKQLLIMPSEQMKDISRTVVNDYFDSIVREAFTGTVEANKVLKDYEKEIAKNKVAIPGTEVEIVRENFHNMGVREIEKILTNPKYEKLSQEMVLEMMNISREAQERLAMEGETFSRNIHDSIDNISDFTTTADNIVKHAAALPGEAFPLFHGKYTKQFVAKAVDNWLINKVMSPSIKNSIKGRLRPYDKWLREKFPEFDSDAQALSKHGVKSDELIVLGDLYKETPMFNPITDKWTTLNSIWKAYQKSKGANKKEYAKVLNALTVRVPQDSASGAQLLRFAGFSGIRDHGLLIHGRAMEKLGGADLDADSAFAFFGGRRSDGSGYGFKETWHQMYKNQKDEFTSRGEVFAEDISSPGSRATAKFANIHNKPYIVNPTGKELAEWIKDKGLKHINIAGSRPGDLKIYKDLNIDISEANIRKVLSEGLKEAEIVRSGGQLGADLIGLQEALKLGKITGGVAPPGYIQQSGKGFKTRKSAKELLISFGLTEGKSVQKHNREGVPYKDIYIHRTEENVKQSDGTVIFAPLNKVQPSKKPMYSQVKDMHHHEVVLNKETIRDTDISEGIFNYVTNKNNKFPYAQFSPTLRTFVGEQTANSRALMSDVVSMTQNHRAAWASVLQSTEDTKGPYEIIESGTISKELSRTSGRLESKKNPLNYRIIRRPKNSDLDKKRQLSLSSALIRFTADPANELGLISRDKMSNLLTNAYYHPKEYQVLDTPPGKKKQEWMNTDASTINTTTGMSEYTKSQLDIKRIVTPDIEKGSRFELFGKINKAFYGKDYDLNKKWTFEQKQELIKGINNLTENEINTALPKLAKLMQNVDYRMSIFDRVNQTAYNNTIANYNKFMKSLKEGNLFKKLLDRTKLDYPHSKQVEFVFNHNLNNAYKRRLMSESNPEDIIKEFQKAKIKDSWHGIKKTDTQEQILNKLDRVFKNVEDYLENSVWEMGGMNLILNEYRKAVKNKSKISDAEFQEMFNAVEFIKKVDRTNLQERGILKSSVEVKEELGPEHKEWIDLLNAEKGKVETTGEKLLDQARIDSAIRDFKSRLSSDYARNVFDYLLLSSFRNKKSQERINAAFKNLPYKSSIQKMVLNQLIKRDGARTSTTRAAFNSKAVSSANIKKFLEAQNRFYKQSGEKNVIPPKADKHIEKFKESKVVELFDPEIQLKQLIDPKVKESLIGDVIGLENIRQGKASPEQKKIVAEFANLIVKDPNFRPEKLNKTLMGLYTYIDPFDPVTKSVDQWNLTDFKNVLNTYKQIKKGSVHKYWEQNLPLLKRLKLKARNQMQFPLMVSTEQMAEDIIFVKKKGFLKDWAGMEAKEVDMLYPTSWGEVLQSQIHRMASMQEAHSSRLANEFMDSIKYLNQTKDGMALHNIALSKIQLKQNFESPEIKEAYTKKWEKIRDLYGWRTTGNNRMPLKDREYLIDIDGSGRRKYKGWEIVNHLMENIESRYKSLFELNSGKFEKITEEEWKSLKTKDKLLYDKDSGGFYSKHPLAEYTLGFYDKKQTQRRLDIDKFMRELSEAWWQGPDTALDFAINVGSDGFRHLMRSMAIKRMPTEKYIKEVTKIDRQTGEIKTKELELNVSEWEKLSRKEQKEWKPDAETKVAKLEKLNIFDTGYRKGYIPHYFNDTKLSKEVAEKEQSEIRSKHNKILEGLTEGTKEYKKAMNDYVQEMKSSFLKFKFANGDYDLGSSQDYQSAMDLLMFKAVKNELVESEVSRLDIANLQSMNKRAGHQHAREEHKMEFLLDPVIHGIYIENATKNLYDSMTNLMTRETLFRMKESNKDKIERNPEWFNRVTNKPKRGKEKDFEEAKEVRRNWDWFWRQYVREAMGMPTIVSQEAWNNPNLHVSTTPYGWFADNQWAIRLNKIADSLQLLDKKGNLPKELQGLDNYDIQKVSSIEARFQLATLMTHPKTPINNIFGGTMHTFQSVGYEPMKKAYDYEYLQTINPKFKNEVEVRKHLDEHGIQIELAKHELGLDKSIRGLKNEQFIDAVSSKAKGGEEIAKSEMEALKKQYGVSKPIMDIATKFMSIPERRLRRDAYLSHYIKAWERFGGAIKNPESPILIELAKKGVKATQFLYSAPFRPAFARSGVGKIMSRFQLWAWNAVRFRNDVRKLAQRYGYKPGSPGMKKFERMMTTDMFVMALGSLFMYSMFEQTIPAPYNWLQDTAQWLFGDEKERERAFFGTYPAAIAPLQLVTPPIARFPISVIREFAEDDYTKLADYYIWTMFPFGRIGRDLLHPEQNIFLNPMRIPEKLLGVPMTGFAKESKRLREMDYDPISPGKSWEIF